MKTLKIIHIKKKKEKVGIVGLFRYICAVFIYI